MKKTALGALLILCLLLLSGCGDGQPREEPTATPLPTAEPRPVARIEAQGSLAEAARALMAPYQDELSTVARKSPALLTYLIPGDLFSQMAKDAQTLGVEAEGGRYAFTWRQSGNHTYTANALEISQIEAAAENSPDPYSLIDPVLDNQSMGDFSATGGGIFERARAYDVDEKMQNGSIEITDMLNDAVTGHEVFTFAVAGGNLYFVDAMLDQAVDVDGLVETQRYLVAAGVLGGSRIEVIEYTVPGREQVPQASPETWSQLAAAPNPISRLQADGEKVQVFP